MALGLFLLWGPGFFGKIGKKKKLTMLIKRIFDICASAVGITFIFPFFIIIVLLIKREDGGPVFYRGVRVGRYGHLFRIFKFCTMLVNAEKLAGPSTADDDSRITTFGKLLRKYKLDELPELFNVLTGDMSIVGPSPAVEKYVRAYPEDFSDILKIRPGLSDYASIKYRDEEVILASHHNPEEHYLHVILPDKLRLAKRYAKEISFSTDLHIIRDTLRSIVARCIASNG